MAAKYSPHEAIALIRRILQQGGYWRPTKHCKEESMLDRDVDNLDIDILLIETGRIESEPEWDKKHQNYVYHVRALDDRGDPLTAVVDIDERNGRVIVITVY